MVKGISRRVVVVRPPDPSVFEEAIFVVRENRDAPRDVLLWAVTSVFGIL